MTAEVRRLRFIPELRNYHLATSRSVAPADTYYFETKYDLVSPEGSHPFRVATFSTALKLAGSGRFDQMEIWEPLWVRLLHRHILLTVTYRLGRLFRFKRGIVASYAMENNDLSALIGGRHRVPEWFTRVFALLLGLYLRITYSRFVFASDGSRETYQGLPFVKKIDSKVIPNLPEKARTVTGQPESPSVVMLARMERRKGVEPLMEAWPIVEQLVTGARITIIGDGPESVRVGKWAAERPESRTYLGRLDHDEALRIVAQCSVLVLPSIRDGRWREQIGLPIHEGLLNGLTIVTTSETGLASWLEERGHRIAALDALPMALTDNLVQALAAPLSRSDVQDQLPDVDGRVVANLWLSREVRQ